MLVLLLLSGQPNIGQFPYEKISDLLRLSCKGQREEWKGTDTDTLAMMCAVASAAEDLGMFKQLIRGHGGEKVVLVSAVEREG